MHLKPANPCISFRFGPVTPLCLLNLAPWWEKRFMLCVLYSLTASHPISIEVFLYYKVLVGVWLSLVLPSCKGAHLSLGGLLRNRGKTRCWSFRMDFSAEPSLQKEPHGGWAEPSGGKIAQQWQSLQKARTRPAELSEGRIARRSL